MTKKIRVLFDGEPLAVSHFSGIGHYTLSLLRAIDTQLKDFPHLDVSIFVHYKSAAKIRSLNFKHIHVIKSPYSQRISNGLKRRNKQPPLDLLFGKGVYVFTNFSSWPLLYSKTIPFIYDLSFERYPEFAAPPNQIFLSQQTRLSAQRADFVATISEHSKQEIHEFYAVPKNKIGVYYPAVDTKHYRRRTDDEIQTTKKKYGISGEYILFVGNIEPRKNLINLLLAYEKLPKKLREKYKLLLIGAKGWQDETIHSTIERLNTKEQQVILPNAYVTDEDIPALFSGASVFVYPSVYEGFGIPPIEAMSCGIPVVCADNSSLPEAAGEAAVMVDALDVATIRDGIQSVLENPTLAASLVAKGNKHITSFGWEKTARQLLGDIASLSKGDS